MAFVGSGVYVPTQGLEDRNCDRAHGSALSSWAVGRISSTRCVQAGEHGRFLPTYTEIFLGCAVRCMADLAITQINRVHLCTLTLRVKGLSAALLRPANNGMSTILKVERGRASIQRAATDLLTILKALPDSKELQIRQ